MIARTLFFVLCFLGTGSLASDRLAADWMIDLAKRSVQKIASIKDTSMNPGDASSQGYVLAAAAIIIESENDGYSDEFKRKVIELGRNEINELDAGQDAVIGGGPAFGSVKAFDAFSDGTENPPLIAYTWNSGMVAWGAMRFLSAVKHHLADEPEWWTPDLIQVGRWVLYWTPYYTMLQEDGVSLGWWYSDREHDARAVHNTSALIAMAASYLSELVPHRAEARKVGQRADAYFRFFKKRLRKKDHGAYLWNYADDGMDPAKTHPEDEA